MSQTVSTEEGWIEQRLRAAAEAAPAASAPQAEASEYDWTVPSRFAPAEVARLEDFARRAAEGVRRALGGLVGETQELAPSLVQQYGERLGDASGQAGQYWTTLMQSGRECGLIAVPRDLAARWVSRLLGGKAQPAESTRELSSLEETLLLDILGAIAEAVSAAGAPAGSPTFARGDALRKGPFELPAGEAREYCRILLGPAGSAEGVCLAMVSDALEPVAASGARGAAAGPDEVRRTILSHLEGVRVPAEARLGTAQVSLRHMMSLEPGDVLVMEKGIGEPIDLLVQGKVVLRGLPVTSAGRYAVQVVSGAPPRARAS